MPTALPESLTIDEARGATASLAAALAAGDWTLDASALRQFDTSAVAVLLELQRQARQAGRALAITGAPANLTALVRLYGVDGLLPLAA